MKALAERAVACKKWRWMAGMVVHIPACGSSPERKGTLVEERGFPGHSCYVGGVGLCSVPPKSLPDLSGPATLGCLRELVREVWGDPHIYTVQGAERRWYICRLGEDFELTLRKSGYFASSMEEELSFSTEVEALVGALEVAP